MVQHLKSQVGDDEDGLAAKNAELEARRRSGIHRFTDSPGKTGAHAALGWNLQRSQQSRSPGSKVRSTARGRRRSRSCRRSWTAGLRRSLRRCTAGSWAAARVRRTSKFGFAIGHEARSIQPATFHKTIRPVVPDEGSTCMQCKKESQAPLYEDIQTVKHLSFHDVRVPRRPRRSPSRRPWTRPWRSPRRRRASRSRPARLRGERACWLKLGWRS